jgi:hypothetical protein
MKFTDYQREAISYLVSELSHYESMVHEQDPSMFGAAGLLDSVSERIGSIRSALGDIEAAECSNDIYKTLDNVNL